MNGTADNSGEIKVIVRTLASLAVICVFTECLLSYFQYKIPPELNTLTGGLVGYLAAMLVKTSPTQTTPTTTTTSTTTEAGTVTTTAPAQAPSGSPVVETPPLTT